MRFEPLTDLIGAEVTGLRIADPPTSETTLELDHALATYGVLFFRDQEFTPAEHVAFASQLGELHIHPYERNLGGEHEGVIEIGSAVSDPSKAYSFPWHADATFEAAPPRASVLRAMSLPPVGGDTLWASMYGAYEGLSSRLQRFVDDLDAEHSAAMVFRARVASGAARPDHEPEMIANTHPVVTTHPVSGRKALFVNQNFTARIHELSPREGSMVLDHLLTTVNDPALQVRLRWSPGTVAMWDNRCTQHCVVGGYDGPRQMQRVTVVGPPPKR